MRYHPERSEGSQQLAFFNHLGTTAGMLRAVYPERQTAEILRFAQDDSEWAQHDRFQISHSF
jgi:hypothetical protein